MFFRRSESLHSSGGPGFNTNVNIVRCGKSQPGPKVFLEILLYLFPYYMKQLCPTEKDFGFDVLDPNLAGDREKLNKKMKGNTVAKRVGYGFNPVKLSIILWEGAPEFSARDIIPKKFSFSHFFLGVMNGEINTDDKAYNEAWKPYVPPGIMRSYKDAHKIMIEKKQTDIPLAKTSKKKSNPGKVEEKEDVEDDDDDDDEEDVVSRPKRVKGSKKPLCIQDHYKLNENEMKKFRDKSSFVKYAKNVHVDPDLSEAQTAQAILFMKRRGVFKVGSSLPVDGQILGQLYADNDLSNSGGLSIIRDRVTFEVAEKKADKINDRAKAALEKVKGVIANDKSLQKERDEDFIARLAIEEKKTDDLAYDASGNLMDPKIVQKAIIDEVDDTRLPTVLQDDRQERKKLLIVNKSLVAGTGFVDAESPMPQVDTVATSLPLEEPNITENSKNKKDTTEKVCNELKKGTTGDDDNEDSKDNDSSGSSGHTEEEGTIQDLYKTNSHSSPEKGEDSNDKSTPSRLKRKRNPESAESTSKRSTRLQTKLASPKAQEEDEASDEEEESESEE